MKKSEGHEAEISSIDDMKEILVYNHDESRSRVESETPMEDLTMDQYTVEMCVLKVHPDREMVHSLLTVKKVKSSKRNMNIVLIHLTIP